MCVRSSRRQNEDNQNSSVHMFLQSKTGCSLRLYELRVGRSCLWSRDFFSPTTYLYFQVPFQAGRRQPSSFLSDEARAGVASTL